jgi:hypothetical protein
MTTTAEERTTSISSVDFDPQMGEAIGAVTERCRGILLGRMTWPTDHRREVTR